MNTKNLFFSVILSIFFFLISVALSPAAAAPRLYLDPASTTVTKDSEFEIKVEIDVEGNNTFGADTILNYPGSDIEFKSITGGGFFPSFSYANDANGRLEIHAFFPNPYESKSGSGTLATIKFTAKKESGTGNITFICTGGGADTQILNTDGENILSCGVLNQSNLTYASVGIVEPSPTPIAGEPNECGGTCGSNYNCQAGLFCYQGFCRNPACQGETDCVCAVATPTPKPKITKTVTPTPQTVELAEYSPPATAEEAEEEETPTAEPEKGIFAGLQTKHIAIGAGALSLLIIVIVAVKKLIDRRKPPEETPPTSTHDVEPPLPSNQPPISPPKAPGI